MSVSPDKADRLRIGYAEKGTEWVRYQLLSGQMSGIEKPVAIQWLSEQENALKLERDATQKAVLRHAVGAHIAAWLGIAITATLALLAYFSR